MLKRFFNWVTGRQEISRLRDRIECLRLENERQSIGWAKARVYAEESSKKYGELRAQMMQLRVSQSTTSLAGWEVMCFIPEEIVSKMKGLGAGQQHWNYLIKRVMSELVALSLGGIHRVQSNGTVRALVFEPLDLSQPARAPRFVQALWDQEGTYKLSEKCWDQSTEEQRVKRAAGGFGV